MVTFLFAVHTIVRPWAAAVGAPGGNAGGCRVFRLEWCEYETVWSWGVWPPEYLSSKLVAKLTRCHQVDSQLGPPGLPESAKKKLYHSDPGSPPYQGLTPGLA